MLLCLHEFFHLLLFLNLLIDLLDLLIKVRLFLLSLADKLYQLLRGFLSILCSCISYGYYLVHFPLFGLQVSCQLCVDLLEDYPLPSQGIDFISHLLIICDSWVIFLVWLVQAVFESLDFLDQLGMLFLWCYPVHALLFLEDLFLDLSYLLINVFLE